MQTTFLLLSRVYDTHLRLSRAFHFARVIVLPRCGDPVYRASQEQPAKKKQRGGEGLRESKRKKKAERKGEGTDLPIPSVKLISAPKEYPAERSTPRFLRQPGLATF